MPRVFKLVCDVCGLEHSEKESFFPNVTERTDNIFISDDGNYKSLHFDISFCKIGTTDPVICRNCIKESLRIYCNNL